MSQPCNVKLEAGKNYAWCSCGLSKNSPFCDGSHPKDKGPIVFKAEETEMKTLCGCGKSNQTPFCDGTHSR